ncbi:zinc finger BED domain-containing protein 4-like [Homarus americanus]|uniref:zinc finger BED domain-containing protein 4-like n=1 Tax=Homarus americanus TaxID=6706 RepID=UPI001C45CE8A|nr:zinc finger BED domain-containing protein 4-like [Homarus americanus]
MSQEVGKLLLVPNATRWNSMYDAVVRLVDMFDNKKTGLQNICRKMEIRFFTTYDIAFLREYKDVMGPIAVGLNVLQGEEKAYMGRLLPMLASALNSLAAKGMDNYLEYCKPLVHSPIQGLKKRFGHLFHDMDCILASATDPNYKLSFWLDWFPDINAEGVRKKATNQLSRLVEKSVHEAESSSSSEGDNKDHDMEYELFQALYETPRRNENDSDLFKCFLGEKPSKKTFDKDTFPNKAMRELFIKYNTPIPSSAAVERMFSMGKDVLRPKRCRMSDKHFEMLVFLRGEQMNN